MFDTWSTSRLLDKLAIDYGPRELLARLFITAAEDALSVGVALEFGKPQDLVDVNKANRASWLPLTTSFHPDYCEINEQNAVVFLGRNRSDEIVMTYAIKLLEWSETTFKREAESLRFFYANPERDKAMVSSVLSGRIVPVRYQAASNRLVRCGSGPTIAR